MLHFLMIQYVKFNVNIQNGSNMVKEKVRPMLVCPKIPLLCFFIYKFNNDIYFHPSDSFT